MEICDKKKFINIILSILLTFFFINFSYADADFKKLKEKKVSYLDFFLLKLENKLVRRSQFLGRQAIASRVQYSAISNSVSFQDKKKILIELYAVMDGNRYSKKKYKQKLSDCNQVRNIIFYRKHGYRFFTQKRNPALSEGVMEDIFKEVFFDNLDFNKKEMEFLLNNMFVKVTIFHPINKTELTCYGKVNDYELR